MPPASSRTRWALLLCALAFLTPAVALAAPTPQGARQPITALGSLSQLPGTRGCLVDRSKPPGRCAPVRALQGPAPLLGSHAIAISPDGRNVYVASSRSNAIAILTRNSRTGTLAQRSGNAGCIAVRGAGGCAIAIGLGRPNSLAVSPDGHDVYATSLTGNAVVILRRDRSTGALTQPGNGTGCIVNVARVGCTTGRALNAPDVVAVSPDGANVYVGAFGGSALAVFARDPSTGALTQPPDTTGCVVNTPTAGCATGLGLGNPEGLTVSPDGNTLYVAAPGSDALDTLTRNPSTGSLTQATDGSGCVSSIAMTGCTLGRKLGGADAVVVGPDGASLYVTALQNNAVTAFTLTSTGQPVQLSGTSACVINVLAVGCSLARKLNGAEGLAVSPDGASLYAVAYFSGALDVFNRNAGSKR
jgi:DNA-binding beta-propeller fold protein YncE